VRSEYDIAAPAGDNNETVVDYDEEDRDRPHTPEMQLASAPTAVPSLARPPSVSHQHGIDNVRSRVSGTGQLRSLSHSQYSRTES
jgi:hypothetical protein